MLSKTDENVCRWKKQKGYDSLVGRTNVQQIEVLVDEDFKTID